MHCPHASPTVVANVFHCGLGLYGGRPHVAVCKQCRHYGKPAEPDDEMKRAGFKDAADAEKQIRAAKQGGCCGQSTE